MEQPTENIHNEFLNDFTISRYVTVFSKLDMKLVQSTIGSAESGRLCDLYQLYELLIANDLRLSGMIQNRNKAVSKLGYDVQSADTDDEKANEVASFVSDNIKRLKWKAYIKGLMDGKSFGVQMHQKYWEKDGNGNIVIKALNPIDKSKYEQANYNSKGLNFGELFISRYGAGTEQLSAKRLVDENVITLAIDKDQRSKYDYSGYMRGVARWYCIKLFAIMAWSQYGEKFGIPFFIGKMPEDKYKANSGILKRLLKSVGINRWGVMYDNMSIDTVNPSSANNVDVFDKLINLCNTEIAIGILGQNLTTDVSGGSFAAAKVHLDVLDNIIEDDAEWITEIVNDQIITPLVAINYPDLPKELYPNYVTQQIKPIDTEREARALGEASRVVPIPTKYVYKKLGIPEPKDNEPTIGGSNSMDLLGEIQRTT